MVLEEIRKRTNYRILPFNNTHVVLYDSHRCIIPVLWQAANEKLINTPCTLIYFDRHSDALKPGEETLKRIKEILSRQSEFKDIFNLTEFHLHSINDNWLYTAMELNLIGDAVLIGGSKNSPPDQQAYTDHQSKLHKLYDIPSLDEALSYQGRLSDRFRRDEFQPLWDTLGWEFSNGHFNMKEDEPILLDFDLDYFSFQWRCIITKAWLPEFFHREFLEPNWYETTTGWTGQRFVKSLLNRAPIITVAKQTAICGGELEVANILRELNNILFDGCLEL
ncbi:hypothetical protein ACFLTR_02660 [Chloroflexota bacterium]